MNNSNRIRLFHWSTPFSFNLDARIQDKNKNFNISYPNNNELTTTHKTIQNISTVFKQVTVPFLELTQIKFLQILFLNLQLRSINSLFFQYTSYHSGIHYMLGKQVGIVVKDTHDLIHYRNLFEHYRETLDLLMERYQLEEPDFITFQFKTLHVDEEIKSIKSNLSKIELHKGLVKVENFKKVFNRNILPYTYNERYFGNLLLSNLREKYLNELIILLEKNKFSVTPHKNKKYKFKISNAIELKNNNWINSFEYGVEFIQYVINSEDFKVFLHETRRYLIISKLDQNYNYQRYVFNLKTGQFLFLSYDILKLDEACKYLYKVKDEKLWIRKTGATSLVFTKNSNIKALISHVPLEAIKYINFKQQFNQEKISKTPPQPMSNPNYGILDLETFVEKNENGEHYSRVFALGFLTKTEKTPKMFYLTDYFDNTAASSSKLVLKCLDEMLNYANSNYIFYVHNLGRFDVIFLQKILQDYNLKVKDKYVLRPFYRDNKILRLIIRLKENRSIKISLVDSMNLLNDKLEKLSEDYNVKTKKGYFPYSFVNKYNLNYEGLTPHISYYNSNIDKIWYYSTLSLNWNLRNETLNYLAKDLYSLLEVLEKFQNHLFIDHNLEMTECLTVSSLAKNKFLKYYLKDSKIPLINNNTLFNFIYSAYFGGNTEVYKPFGKNLTYLDVNSLYPYTAINPMPGIECIWVECFDSNGLDLELLFGVFHAEVISSDLYLGLLPMKTNSGLIFPNGKFHGIWTSIELQFAKKYGYKIKVTKGYQFSKSENVFKSYVEDLSKLKNELTGSKRQVIKSLLNNLLGRFALNYVKPITKTVNKKMLDNILATRVVKTFKEINSDSFILTYLPLLDKQVCESHGIDYYKAILNERMHSIVKFVNVFQDTSIIISAFTTAYARVHMNKIKLDILAAGGSIYYSDTDSVVTDLTWNNLKEVMPEKVGTELGQLKFEYKINKGYFISNKVYALLLDDGTIIKKGKGFSTNSVSLSEYEKMYLYSRSIKANKIYSKTNYSLGSVLIDNKEVIIDWNSYKKREKIYNTKTNLWINTRPLYIDNLSKSISLYVPKNIIKFTATTYPKSKVIIELNKQRLIDNLDYAYFDKFYNIINTTTVPNSNLRPALLFAPSLVWVLGYSRWLDNRFISTLQSLRISSGLLRGEEVSKYSININYFNSFLLLGIGFCLFAPILIYYLTGVNIYDKYSFTDSASSSPLYNIRLCCATVFLNLIILFVYLNNNKFSKLNKPIMWASTLIVKGGFEGLGWSDIEEQPENSKSMRSLYNSKFTDLEVELPLSLSATQKESQIKDSSSTTPLLNSEIINVSPSNTPKLINIPALNNPDLINVSTPNNPDIVNVPDSNTPDLNKAKASKERSTSSGYPFWPWSTPTGDIPNLTGSSSEPALTPEDNKKVRINKYAEVKFMTETGLDNTSENNDELIQLGPKNKPQKLRADDRADERSEERANNINNNSEPSNSKTPNCFKGKKPPFDWLPVFKWERAYPKEGGVEVENWPELEVVNPNLEGNDRYMSSSSIAKPNLENINGHITKPSSSLKIDAQSHLQKLKNKLK